MMKTAWLGLAALLAGSLWAADANPKQDVAAAAKKLAGETGYSWTSSTRFNDFESSAEGKTEKDGATSLAFTFGDNTVYAALKGKRAALKTERGWQTVEEALADSEPGFGQILPRMLQNFRLPAAEAEDMAGAAKELKKEGDLFTGDLTEDGAKKLLTFGENNPRNAKGSVKFWVKEGGLSKFEVHLTGTVKGFNQDDMDVDRTTTIEIKDAGKTKVSLPDDANKKLP